MLIIFSSEYGLSNYCFFRNSICNNPNRVLIIFVENNISPLAKLQFLCVTKKFQPKKLLGYSSSTLNNPAKY